MTHTPALLLLIETLIDFGDFVHPPLPLAMLQVHDLPIGPMKVVCDIGYLLKQSF
jgi:hypothetical protein